MCKKFTFLLILSFGLKANSQEETVSYQENMELFQFDYTLYPIGKDDIHYAKTKLKVNVPTTFGKFSMTNSLGLEYYQITYASYYNFDKSTLDSYNDLSYTLDVDYSISKQWVIGATMETSLTSNSSGKISTKDLFFNGGLSAGYKFGTTTTSPFIKFGVGYYTFLGKPQWLPVFLYTQQLSNDFSIGIGFPKSSMNYKLNDRNLFDLSLVWSGLYANLRTPQYMNATAIASKAQFNDTSLAIAYNYKLDPNWSFYFGMGYQLKNEYLMLDTKENSVYDFQTLPKPYFSSGIKFNIKNK